MAGHELDQVPQIAVEVLPHRDPAIVVIGGRADPLDPGGGEAGVGAGEVVGGDEQEDATAGLVADVSGLVVGGGAGEEDGGGVGRGAGRADGDPALVLLGLVFVGDEGEAEFADVEGDGLVIVANDEGDVGQVGIAFYSKCGCRARGAGEPLSKPSVLKSSSMSGQWIP